jgi:hypothetical protein
MIRPIAFFANLELVRRTLQRETSLEKGSIIECGTWRGGMSAALISIGGPAREYFFFDSFSGLPPPDERDGAEAFAWTKNTDGPRYFNNCTASLDEFMSTIARANYRPGSVHVIKGDIDRTFSTISPPAVAILRVDVDWYRSTFQCLEKFWDHVVPGGLIILDDYYDWEGCRKAVHDFLSARHSSAAIRQTAFGKVAYIIKN